MKLTPGIRLKDAEWSSVDSSSTQWSTDRCIRDHTGDITYEASLGADDDDDDDDDEEDEDDGEEAPFETILLGHIVRFDKDRRHPENLAEEAVDILQRIIHGAESLEDADKKAIDDLLGSL